MYVITMYVVTHTYIHTCIDLIFPLICITVCLSIVCTETSGNYNFKECSRMQDVYCYMQLMKYKMNQYMV